MTGEETKAALEELWVTRKKLRLFVFIFISLLHARSGIYIYSNSCVSSFAIF